MHRLRDQLLAGAALSLDEHRAVRGRHPDERVEQLPDRRRGAHQPRSSGRLEAALHLVRVGDGVADFASRVTAPRRIASTLVATEPKAVITRTGVPGNSRRTSRSTTRPSPSGMRKSVTTASKRLPAARASSSLPTASETPKAPAVSK